MIETIVQPIYFEDRSGHEFERLASPRSLRSLEKFRDVVQNYHLTKHLIEIKRYYYALTSKIGCAENPSPYDDPQH
jgi:hypothetical protein